MKAVAEITTIKSPIENYLTELISEFKENKKGLLADYIPELAKANSEWFGIALATVDGQIYQVGDSQQKFTIQSISKPFTYALTLDTYGIDYVLNKVGVEPSGEAFNEISLEVDSGRPFNPMINAGAIATTSMVPGDNAELRFKSILKKYEEFACNSLKLDEDVYRSESSTGNRNRAIAYLLKNSNIIDNDTEESLDLYFRQCSILVNCRDLAMMGATLANNGINPITGVVVMKPENVEKVLSIMSTCGMYDYAGGWIYDVGMPAKSGVAGGIVAVLPGQCAISVFSPPLDKHGNSERGIQVCQKLSKDFGLHMLDSSKASNSVIRAKYDTTSISSKRTRTVEEFDVLRKQGSQIKIYELAGDLIFSSADHVLETILKELDITTYIILDFKRVTSVKKSACYLLASLIRIVQEKNKHIYFTNTDFQFNKTLKYQLDKELFNEVQQFHENDAALECCEDSLIFSFIEKKKITDKVSLSEQPVLKEFDDEELQYIKKLMNKRVYTKGDIIVSEGDKSNALYFITIGEANITMLNEKNNSRKRVATLSAGMSFGEMSIIDKKERSATVSAESDIECYELVFSNFDEKISNERPDIKIKLLTNIVEDLSNKLRKVNQEIRAYQ
jgi:glutaminase